MQPTSEVIDVRKQPRKRGHPANQLNFRCPDELREAAKREGEDLTDGLIVLLDRGNDAKAALGDLWIEVVVFAHRQGITEGEALGRLAKVTLEKEQKHRR